MEEKLQLHANSNDSYQKLYQGLVDTVRFSMNEQIDKDRIEQTISAVIDAFEANPYNELLMHFYTNTKDNYILAHIANSVILSIAFATSFGLSRSDIGDVAYCAFGHDFGMKEYLDLFQKTTALTPEESSNIHQHPQKSYEIFKSYFSQRVLDGILDMHECVNGQGYPKGKTGLEISFLAKIVSICDVYEALTHPRAFRGEFSPYEALKILIKKKEIIFERKVVKRFVEFMSIYPVGSLVHLNTGEIAIVIASNPSLPTRSILRVLMNPQKEVQQTGRIINLLNDPLIYISGPVESREEKEIRTAFSITVKEQ